MKIMASIDRNLIPYFPCWLVYVLYTVFYGVFGDWRVDQWMYDMEMILYEKLP